MYINFLNEAIYKNDNELYTTQSILVYIQIFYAVF